MFKLDTERLRALMHKRGVTQRQLASACGLSITTVSHYVTGTRQPTGPNLMEMCKVLRASPAALMKEVSRGRQRF